MKAALHRINLDEIGGVERLFDNFVKNSTETVHHIVLNKAVHAFLNQVGDAHVHNIKWKNGRKIPRPFRRGNVKRIFKAVDPSIMLYWDTEEKHLGLLKKNTPVIFYDHGYSWLNRRTKRFSQFLQRTDLCIACSHASKRILELRWGTSCPIEVIQNPLRPDLLPLFISPRKALRQKVSLGSIGRLVPVKGHCIALHALAGLKKAGVPAELHIAGVGPERASLESLAKKLDIEKELFFHGCIDNIASFYENIDICLTPSICEPFGLVSLEAQAFGVVPIVAYRDGLAETIIPGESGVGIAPSLEPGYYTSLGGSLKGLPPFVYDPIEDRLQNPQIIDPSRIVEEVVSLLNNPDHYERLSRGAIDNARSNFPFNSYVGQVESIIEKCIHSTKQTALHTGHFGKHPSLSTLPQRHTEAPSICDTALYWNTTGPFKSSKRRLFYDHGLSWSASLPSFDGAIASSHASKRMLELRCNFTKPITTILPYTSLPQVAPKKRPSYRPFVLGALAPAASLAIHAAASLGNVHLMIAGADPKDKLLNKLIRDTGMENRVLLLGRVTDQEGFYAGIDALLASLLYAPTPLPLMEALAHGCPVLAPRLDSLPEVIDEGKNGFCLELELDAPTCPALQIYDPALDALTSPKMPSPRVAADAAVLLFDRLLHTEMSAYALEHAAHHFSFNRYQLQLMKTLGEQ